MPALKPTLLLGHHKRPAPIDPSDIKDATVIGARSQGDYIDALNSAFANTGRTVIVLQNGKTFTAPLFKGRTKSKEIIHHGETGDETVIGDKWRIVGFYSSNNFGFSNLTLDGRGGASRKGIVVGSTKIGKDPHEGPVHKLWLDNVKAQDVAEQLFLFSDESTGLKMRAVDLVNSGIGPNGGSFAEGCYLGAGGFTNVNPRHADIESLYVANTNGGECFDVKVNFTDLKLRFFELEGNQNDYSGALTLGIDANDGGHGRDANLDIADGYIHNVRDGKYINAGIQAGTGAKLRRILIDGVHDGYGIGTLAQAHGPNKTLDVADVVILNAERGSISENTFTAERNKANPSPMTLKLDNVHTDDGHPGTTKTDRTAAEWAKTIWGIIPPPLPAPPIVVSTPKPTPRPPAPGTDIPPAPAHAAPAETQPGPTTTVKPAVIFDLTDVDDAITALQSARAGMAAQNERNGQ